MQNLVIGGPVTWFQHWEPNQWSGTLAFRLDLGELNGHNHGEMFIQCSYPKDKKDSNQIKYYCNYLTQRGAKVLVLDGHIAERTKDEKTTYSIRTSITKAKLNSAVAESRINIAQLYGKVEIATESWLRIATPYRNPKANETKYRHVQVYVPANLIQSPVEELAEQYVYVQGIISANDFANQQNAFVIAQSIS